MYIAWAGALLLAIPGGMILSLAPPLRVLDDPLICGAGDRMIIYQFNDDYGLGCAKQPDKSLLLHYAGSIVLFVSLVVIIGVVIAAYDARAPLAARRREPES